MTEQNDDLPIETRTGGPDEGAPTGESGRGRGALDNVSTDAGARAVNDTQENEAPIGAAHEEQHEQG